MCEINVQISDFRYSLNTENVYIYIENHLSLNINIHI